MTAADVVAPMAAEEHAHKALCYMVALRDAGSIGGIDDEAQVAEWFAQAMADARREALELCAQHVEAKMTLALSGMPADNLITDIARTFRSQDWADAVAGRVK